MKLHLLHYVTRVKFLWVTLSLATVTTLILVACGGGTATTPTPTVAATATSQPTTAATATSKPVATMMVKIVENNGKYAFDPATLTIAKGTKVIWTNNSDAPHTVTSDTGVFNTPSNLTQSQTFMTTFTTAGTFAYHCNIHPYMKATITVTA